MASNSRDKIHRRRMHRTDANIARCKTHSWPLVCRKSKELKTAVSGNFVGVRSCFRFSQVDAAEKNTFIKRLKVSTLVFAIGA